MRLLPVFAVLLCLAPISALSAGRPPGAHRERCLELERTKLRPMVLEDRRRRDFALFEAARKGCGKLAEALLDAGASLAARNRFGNTPLHEAAAAGALPLVRLFLDRGAEIDRPNLAGRTPLMKAVDAGRRRVARLLLKRGADPDHRDGKGISPLAIAAFNGDIRMVKRLLTAGADPDPVDRSGKSPIVYASARGFAAIVSALLEAGVDAGRSYGHDLTALMWAAGYANDTPAPDALATARLLLEHGARINARDDRGMTALMIAAQRNHPRMVEMLLAQGADPGLRDRRGRDVWAVARSEAVRARLAAADAQSAAR